MKRIVAYLLAVITILALFSVPAFARGYSLSIPKTVSSHNLEAYGLHTMDVYQADKVPTIDGRVDTNEYPGPNGGCSLSAGPGDNMWMSSYHNVKSSSEDQNGFYGRFDFTDYVLEEDKPNYIKNYLTYDDEYLYFAVTTTIPEIRMTIATDTEKGLSGIAIRDPNWWFETFVNFMQTENIACAHSNSLAQTRYVLNKYDYHSTAVNVSFTARTARLLESQTANKAVAVKYTEWIDDDLGIKWDSITYKRAENFSYQVTVLDDGRWKITFEGRQPLGDVLRITDVEYEDGTPIDYVPEWGAWGVALRLQSSGNIDSSAPDGTDVILKRDDVIYAQTMLPGYGAARTGKNSYLNGYLFHNTVSNAINSSFGANVNFLMNPVHFLGKYDETFNYDGVYSQATGSTIVATTSRITRNRTPILTSGVRGVNYRVIGVATSAASATGDNITLTVVLSAVMLLCAMTAVVVVLMKKRSSHM